MFITQFIIYIAFIVCMFKYAPSVKWIVIFVFLTPILAMNIILCFACPLLFLILMPIVLAPGVLQSPLIMDATLPLFISLAGALLKLFVRPTDDDENPYAQEVPSIAGTIIYVIFLFLFFVFLFFMTVRFDNRIGVIPWTVTFLNYTWAEVGAPLWLAQFIGSHRSAGSSPLTFF